MFIKEDSCLYCGLLSTQMVDHLNNYHCAESAVFSASVFPPEISKDFIQAIINLGNLVFLEDPFKQETKGIEMEGVENVCFYCGSVMYCNMILHLTEAHEEENAIKHLAPYAFDPEFDPLFEAITMLGTAIGDVHEQLNI